MTRKKSRFPSSKAFYLYLRLPTFREARWTPPEFKEFIFCLLFLKRLSDEFDREREQLRKKDGAHTNKGALLESAVEEFNQKNATCVGRKNLADIINVYRKGPETNMTSITIRRVY